jgi:hypothetical protein
VSKFEPWMWLVLVGPTEPYGDEQVRNRHATAAEAEADARRMAVLLPNQVVMVYQRHSAFTCEVGPVKQVG